MQKTETQTCAGDSFILSRILAGGSNGLSPEVARHFLSVTFSDADKALMHELAVKNREGTISAEELQDLDNYIKAGDLLAMLKSKARLALRKKTHS